MKAYWGSGGMAPRILNLGSTWSWAVGFRHRSLYLRGKSPQCTLCKRLHEPQSWSGRSCEKKESHHCPWRGSNPSRSLISVCLNWAWGKLRKFRPGHSQLRGRDLNPGPPKCKAGAVTSSSEKSQLHRSSDPAYLDRLPPKYKFRAVLQHPAVRVTREGIRRMPHKDAVMEEVSD